MSTASLTSHFKRFCKFVAASYLIISIGRPASADDSGAGSMVLSIVTTADFEDLSVDKSLNRLAPIAVFRRVEHGSVSSVVFDSGKLPDVQSGYVILVRPPGSSRDQYMIGLLSIQIRAEQPSVAMVPLVKRMVALYGEPLEAVYGPNIVRHWQLSPITAIELSLFTDEENKLTYAIEYAHVPLVLIKPR